MAICVTFSGSATELMELFSNDLFRDLLKKVEPAKTEPAKTEPDKVEPAKAEPVKVEPAIVESEKKPSVSRAQMLNAMQEYCVRMNNRYSGVQGYDTRAMCADLLLQCTGHTASHTSKVDSEYFEDVFNAAINDVIPETFKHIVNGD